MENQMRSFPRFFSRLRHPQQMRAIRFSIAPDRVGRFVRTTITCLGLVPLVAACGSSESVGHSVKCPDQPQRLVLSHVGVVNVREGRLDADQSIVVEGDRITSVQSRETLEVRECDHVLPLEGLFALPGFVDMHVHVPVRLSRKGGDFSTQYDWKLTAEILALLIRNGVTTVRVPGSNTEAVVHLREMIAEERILGPELRVAGRILIASEFDAPWFAPVATPDEIRQEIRWQAAAGVDLIKVYANMSPEQIAVAVEEARRHGLPVIGHLGRTTWTEAAQLGVAGVSHPAPWSVDYLKLPPGDSGPSGLFGRIQWLERVEVDSPIVTAMIEGMSRAGTYVDLTLIAMHTKMFGDDARWTANPLLAHAPSVLVDSWRETTFTSAWTPAMYEQAHRAWPKLEAWTRALHQGGVRLTVGTDTPTPWIIPGSSFHDELELLVGAGIAEADVLRMATLGGAEALGLEDRIGSIETGREADILLLTGNPLEDIRATREIRTLLVNGLVMTPSAISVESILSHPGPPSAAVTPAQRPAARTMSAHSGAGPPSSTLVSHSAASPREPAHSIRISKQAMNSRTREEDVQAIERLHAQDMQASAAQDFVTLRSLMDDHAVVLPPGSRPVRGAVELDRNFQKQAEVPPSIEVLEYRFEWEDLEILGDTAIEWGRIHGSVRPQAGGNAQDVRYNVLRVLRRQSDGTWKVYRSIWNAAPTSE